MEIITEINIKGSTASVWSVLTNFSNYSNWNPFIKSISGKAIEGEKIKVEFEEMSFKPTVLVFKENKEFKWLGRLGLPFIFDGTHRFQLIKISDKETKFIHSEKFSGILVAFFKKKLRTETKNGFEKLNHAIKKEVEKLNI